jgi:hypothetical protein
MNILHLEHKIILITKPNEEEWYGKVQIDKISDDFLYSLILLFIFQLSIVQAQDFGTKLADQF